MRYILPTSKLQDKTRTDVALAFQVWDQEHLIAFWPRVEKDDKVTDEANEMLIKRPLLIEKFRRERAAGKMAGETNLTLG